VVEGYHAARVLREVAARLKLDLPVCESICRILFDGADAGAVVRELMARPPQAEFE
jgi:glycerol-3-phosphate dehydrogenase (NAD(P)+)